MTKRKVGYSVFILCALWLAQSAGGQSPAYKGNRRFMTETQVCFLKHFTHLTGEVFPLCITLDVPVEGPGELMDSITVFLNKTLYAFFDNGSDRHLPYEQVHSKNRARLADHYRDLYFPYFEEDRSGMHEFLSDCLDVKLATQTDTYVTYGVEHIFWGEGVETDTEWITFLIGDGHRLSEVISELNLYRFYKDHPEYRNDNVCETVLDRYRKHIIFSEDEVNVGLLADSVAIQYVYAPGIFEIVKYPANAISPYLSTEAQELILNTTNRKQP